MGYAIDTLDQLFQMLWLAMELSVWIVFAWLIMFFIQQCVLEIMRAKYFMKKGDEQWQKD